MNQQSTFGKSGNYRKLSHKELTTKQLLQEHVSDDDNDVTKSESSGSLSQNQASQDIEKDLILVSARVSQFWKPSVDSGGPSGPSASLPSSWYLNDFEELQPLGHGGFGHDESLPVNDRIFREVATLSRLQHQHVFRYYEAWFETGDAGTDVDSMRGSGTAASSAFSNRAASSADVAGQENKLESTYLYIQMEYFPCQVVEVVAA
ncbi:eIF-2-alpha kinase GCN2-like [Melia azedarach]|uniref:EIF-2-alpha kinase GCN2-like n=1 Tax=Melia azedarach TaxID=155640 RepID=A0ACC1YJ42_MELAZ|nr:eIF-2-alpha kinase GCN2-like [Melia azedarach]